MGRPKLELLDSNGVATFVTPFSITLNARHTHIKQMHTCIHRHTHTNSCSRSQTDRTFRPCKSLQLLCFMTAEADHCSMRLMFIRLLLCEWLANPLPLIQFFPGRFSLFSNLILPNASSPTLCISRSVVTTPTSGHLGSHP